MNALNIIKITLKLWHASWHMFRVLLAHHQGAHDSIR